MALRDAMVAEITDLKVNHLRHIYDRLVALETDGRWTKRFMAGIFGTTGIIAAGLLVLVAKSLSS